MRPIRYVATAAEQAAGTTAPIVVDYLEVNALYSLQYLAAGGGAGAGAVQFSLDDPFTITVANMNWETINLNVNKASVASPVRAFRINGPSTGDVLTVVQQGAR